MIRNRINDGHKFQTLADGFQSSQQEPYQPMHVVQLLNCQFCSGVNCLLAGFISSAAWLFLVAGSVSGEEPAQRFLDELRANHYYDVAIDYLDQMQTSPLATEAFKSQIPLEKANTLMASVSRIRDARQREATLDQAQKTLDDFLSGNPAGDLRSMAERTRATLLIARATLIVDNAKKSRMTVDQMAEVQDRAREYLQSASSSFDINRQKLADEIRALGTPTSNEGTENLRNLQREFVIVRRFAPIIKEKLADTYSDETPERNKLLLEAAEDFAKIYDDYSQYEGGLDAALFSARCYEKLKRFDEALSMVTLNIFIQDNIPAFYDIKKRGALIALSCWEQKDPLPFNEIIYHLTPIIQNIRQSEKQQEDWLILQLGYAKACKSKSDSIRESGATSPDERKLMNETEDIAIDLARIVSNSRSSLRDEARALLLEWNQKVADSTEQKEPPKNVSEARDRARAMSPDIEDARRLAKDLESQIKAGGDATVLQKELDAAKTELQTKVDEMLKVLELALQLADEQTPIDDISYVRYLQAYCYFQRDQFLEATVIGTFLMDNFPDKAGAKDAMGLVCKAYWQMYNDAPDDNRQHELQELAKNCTKVLDTWPGTGEAEMAAQLMTIVALTSNDSVKAEEYLNRIPENSASRVSLLLNVGQSVWQDYVRQRKAGGGVELFELRDRAKKYLDEGAATVAADSLTSFQARCLLSLTELYLDEGNIEAALNQLEKAQIAPLDLVKQKHPAVDSSEYRLDTYRAAIRGYLGALQTGENTQVWIEKAQNIIDAMSREFENQENGQKKLVSIYYRLANELKSQFDSIEDANQKQSFGQGLDVFLSGIAGNAKDSQVLIWCGSTMSSVGESLIDAGAKDLGRRMFEKAIGVFDRVGNSSDVDSGTKLMMLRRKALAYAGMGQYQTAIDTFEELFQDPQNQKYIDLQIDVAETFQEWGFEKNKTDALAFAVGGGINYKDPKTNRDRRASIGWKKIAEIAMKNRDKSPAETERYYSAMYNLMKCRFEYGRQTSKPEVIKAALAEITGFQNRHADGGGPVWKPKFDALAAEIKRQSN